MIFVSFLAAQTLVAPPGPPMPPRADTALFEQDRLRYADDLRRACLSEKGIEIAIAAWTELRRDGPLRVNAQQANEQELGAAAYSATIDPDRIEHSLEVKRRLNDAFLAASDASSVSVLRKLSPADRRIFARRLTILQSSTRPQQCATAGAVR
ncbi:hypothetical protein [Sphingomonas immobilis]|uniref:Uncharacterized protein n=1 Tax=Sphingomonas immobilis TaxID=3063997 RepID=A0ABT8ZZI9_9SPHN|nr:hypothetical protein [Sphingomonas sp. CA1-15]MDO7843000.1 hypothetical protein [Sphingomonas sp. CA1-15]